ncbi:MAG: TIGR02099 family protein [gamma proteobacterium symbiont of Ctena orbiculata]|nr:MAG: TIGR02099 family protein [gamma proteobacterium symbiont of Ctena orbiculata]PVV15713.1 MAG: TIGR02099 family protein [gamma proteobacterium symbiont of Ctena orbiculata]
MLNTAKYLHAKFWQTLAWVVIAAALLITGLRLIVPVIDLDPYRRVIERVAEEAAGVDLKIGAMKAQVKGVHLALNFTDVSVLDEQSGDPLLSAPQVLVNIQLVRSLLSGQLQLGGASVIGTRLKLERFADGSVALQGMGGVAEGDPDTVVAILLGQNQLRLLDTEIHLKSAIPDQPPLRLSGVNVDLRNNGLRHQLSLATRIGKQGEESVRLIANLLQKDANSLAMSGEFYVRCEGLVLGGRLSEWMPAPYTLDEGELEVELWGDLEQGVLHNLRGKGELNGLRVNGPGRAEPFELQNLSTELDWRRVPDGWQLELDRLAVRQSHGQWPTEQLSVTWQSTEQLQKQFRLGADALSLMELNDFLAILKLPNPELHAALKGLSPEGELQDLEFEFFKSEAGDLAWRLKGEVDDYTHQPWQDIPGLSGLKLAFDGNQVGGWLKIDSSDLLLEFPQLFRMPLHAQRAMGDFVWNFDLQKGLHLNSKHLQMSTRDVQTLSRIDLQIPFSGKDLFIDMQSDFWDADGSRKSDYLPVGIMPDELVEWLDTALVSGYVKSGSFLLYGPISEFPFRQQQGRFEVWFGVEDLILDYMPEWPRLSEGVAEVHFINNSLKVKLQDGLLLNSQLQDVEVEIERLKEASPVIIRGSAAGPLQDLMAILGETPLRSDFHAFVDAVEVAGESRTVVDLAIPLKQRDKLKIEGEIGFKQASLKIKKPDLPIDKLSGNLRFNRTGVEAEGIRARLLGDAIVFDVLPYSHEGEFWTRLTTRMPIDLKRLKRQFPEWTLDYFTGRGEGDIEVKIAHHPSQVPVRLNLVSDLQGISIRMPEPLGKAAESKTRFDMGADFRNDESTELRIRYQDQTHALFRFFETEKKPWIAAIGFSREALSLDDVEGLHLRGHLQRLNADSWVSWVRQQAATEGEGLSQIAMDLSVDELVALGTTCPETRFTYKNYADGYRIDLASDTAQGMIQIPQELDQRPIYGRFDYLKFDLKELARGITGQQGQRQKATDLDPRDVPAINITVEDLYINDQPMGKGYITWRKEVDGITVDSLALVGDGIDLSGQGYWRLTPRGHSTSLNLQLHTGSLGDLQHALGITTGIEQAPTDVKAELYWPTSPLEMGAEKLYGSISLKVNKGLVNNVDPGVGRLIGLFSLNALGKRLALDFSDLFSEGLAFDSIEGNFTVNDGDAYTSDLVMKSTAAVIEVRGRTGLASRTYDQKIVVTPNVSATLPLLGTLAINPTAGVALAMTQKLIGRIFDRIAERTYEVTGSWDNPQYTQVDIADKGSGGSSLMPEMPGE